MFIDWTTQYCKDQLFLDCPIDSIQLQLNLKRFLKMFLFWWKLTS